MYDLAVSWIPSALYPFQVERNVFPRAASQHFAFEGFRIRRCCIVPVVRVEVVLKGISIFNKGWTGPLRYVARHVVESVVIGEVGIGLNRVQTTIFRIVAPCQVWSWQANILWHFLHKDHPMDKEKDRDHLWRHIPLCFGWQTVNFGINFSRIFVFVVQSGSPIAECGCLVPVYANYRIIIKGRMPEIISCERLVVAIWEISDPAHGVRMISTSSFDVRLTLGATCCCTLPVEPLVFVFEFSGVHFLCRKRPYLPGSTFHPG